MSNKGKEVFVYLEIIEKSTGNCLKRFDVTRNSDRSKDMIQSGMNMNLNHVDYRVSRHFSTIKLETI